MLDRREFRVGEQPLDLGEQRRVVLGQHVRVSDALGDQVLGDRRQHRLEIGHVRRRSRDRCAMPSKESGKPASQTIIRSPWPIEAMACESSAFSNRLRFTSRSSRRCSSFDHRAASARARSGRLGITPSLVQAMPPQTTPKRTARRGSRPSASATAKPELNASPAPVVSVTSTSTAGTRTSSVVGEDHRAVAPERDDDVANAAPAKLRCKLARRARIVGGQIRAGCAARSRSASDSRRWRRSTVGNARAGAGLRIVVAPCLRPSSIARAAAAIGTSSTVMTTSLSAICASPPRRRRRRPGARWRPCRG